MGREIVWARGNVRVGGCPALNTIALRRGWCDTITDLYSVLIFAQTRL